MRRLFNFLASGWGKSPYKKKKEEIREDVRLLAESLGSGKGWVITDNSWYLSCDLWDVKNTESNREMMFSYDSDTRTWGFYEADMNSEEKRAMIDAFHSFLVLRKKEEYEEHRKVDRELEKLFSNSFSAS